MDEITKEWLADDEISDADRLRAAAKIYHDRNPGKTPEGKYMKPLVWPNGHFANRGHWMPNPKEVALCCQQLADPYTGSGKIFPYTFLKHCMSFKHVAALCGTDDLLLRRAVKAKIYEKDAFRQSVMAAALIENFKRKEEKCQQKPSSRKKRTASLNLILEPTSTTKFGSF